MGVEVARGSQLIKKEFPEGTLFYYYIPREKFISAL